MKGKTALNRKSTQLKDILQTARHCINNCLDAMEYFEQNPNSDSFDHWYSHHVISCAEIVARSVESLPYVDFKNPRKGIDNE